MLVYKDLFTDDEIISDSYPQRPVLNGEDEVPGLFEVDSRIVAVGGDNIDIGCGSEFGGGDVDVAVDDSIEKENNIISERAGFGYTVGASMHLVTCCNQLLHSGNAHVQGGVQGLPEGVHEENSPAYEDKRRGG
jgi:hypothetical protein